MIPRPGSVSLVALAGPVLVAACSVAPAGTEINDPYEALNRQIHAFNVGLDRAVLDPAGEVANELPDAITIPVVNFSDNASLPNSIINGVLQGNAAGAITNSVRFLLNSTIGVLGLFDPAGAIGIEPDETDFGETLAVWGFPEGAYIELPGLGPSTERDATGRLVDFFLDPLQLFGAPPRLDGPTPEILELDTVSWAAEQVIERGELDDTFDELLYESADSYAQLRLIYLQNRRFELGEEAGDANSQSAEDYYFDPYQDQ
jgi:phospholipid-binding lipoprotein MlaA